MKEIIEYVVAVVVLKALKRDVIRSIIARCELLCEDLLQAEEEQGWLISVLWRQKCVAT